ncbi:unnamed protein product [Closterium sp. NIES-54]
MAKFTRIHFLFKKKHRRGWRVTDDGWYTCEPPEPPAPQAPLTPPAPPASPAPPDPPAPLNPPATVTSTAYTGKWPVIHLLLPATFDEWLSEPESDKPTNVYVKDLPPKLPRWGQPEDRTWDESAVGADDDVAADEQPHGNSKTGGNGETGAEAGREADVFPEGGVGAANDDGLEHKLSQHKCNSYTAQETVKWLLRLELAASVSEVARESSIDRKCLTEWKNQAQQLKDAHSAQKRLHGRGRSSWYRPMEIQVYAQLLDWHPRETLTPQQLREWYVQRGTSRSSARCPYVIRKDDRAGQTCGTVGHTKSRCFSCLSDTWRAKFGDAAELPLWLELITQGVDVFALDYDVILTAIYALIIGAEGDFSLCVLPDPGIEAAALGASESPLPGTAPAEALHTFTLDSGASRCFFRDSTTLTPLSTPVPVRLADPSGSPVLALSSTVLPCPAVPSGSLSGLQLPSFSTNLVSTAALHDAMVTTTTPGGQRVAICTYTRTGRHLATFTRRPGSSLYTLATEPPQVATSAQVSASGQVAPPCSCRLLSHQTLLWHHRLGHPSLPRLRGMHSRLLVSGLPRSLPPFPPSPAPPCLPCVEGRQGATPHSSFPPTTAPLHTLHTDVWSTARVSDQGRERYFLLVFDDYTRYTTVFPLRSKSQIVDVLISWIRAVRLQLREQFHQDLPVLRLHSDRGGEFSSDLLRDFCRGEGILQSFTLPDPPQQNGIAERRIGLVMEVARTSMIHAAAPHFLWPFAVRYAAHQLNLWPRVSLPETSPTLRWTGKVGDASVFRVWGSHVFVRDSSADKLSTRAIPCVFLGFPSDAPGW